MACHAALSPLTLSITAYCNDHSFGLISMCSFFMPLDEGLSSFQSFLSFLFSLVDEHCRPEYHPTHMVLRPPDQVLMSMTSCHDAKKWKLLQAMLSPDKQYEVSFLLLDALSIQICAVKASMCLQAQSFCKLPDPIPCLSTKLAMLMSALLLQMCCM